MKTATFIQRTWNDLRSFPLFSLAGFSLALLAQFLLEPAANAAAAVVFYIAAMGFIVWGIQNGEWKLASLMPESLDVRAGRPRLVFLLGSAVLLAAAFYFFGNNRFTTLNLTLWLSGIVLFICAFWQPYSMGRPVQVDGQWLALLAAVLVLAAFFRFYHIDQIPAEPFSDHAEKLLDVHDISQGKTSIFFERNTGREALQMYWTLLTEKIAGTGFSFLTLKLGTAVLGFLTLPFVYLLGRELGNPLVGFFALFLFGIAYWPNVISRIGLRFPLYPLFVAPTLFYLIHGLRSRSQNDFLLCGLFLGCGLHGYSPFRIMPLVVVLAFVLFILHEKSREARLQALWWLGLVVLASIVVFLPLLRYWLEHPDIVSFRALSRLGLAGREIPGPVWWVFLSNLLRGLLMFNWDDGDIWVNSIPHRPALDVVTGALFVIGVILLLAHYARERDWRDLLLLVLIPSLLLPSVLALAFPIENPALNRAGAAAVVAIIVGARALDGFVSSFGARTDRVLIAHLIVAALLVASSWQNYDLVFRKFNASYKLAVWNASEMSEVIRDHGHPESSWIVPYPHWVDTRLPAIELGRVEGDLALWREDIAATGEVPAPKLFLFKPEDIETENALKQVYPGGTLSRYTSANIGKDFMIFFVEE